MKNRVVRDGGGMTLEGTYHVVYGGLDQAQNLVCIGLNEVLTKNVDNFVGKVLEGGQKADKSSFAWVLPKK